MLKGKSILVAMFLLALFAVSAVSAADNATEDISDMGETLSDEVISVEETQVTGQANDDETIGETDDGTFTALQQKINDANFSATIKLYNDYKYNDGFSTSGINVAKNLTIDGQGHTIDGDGKARIFWASWAVFKNITFIKGKTQDVEGRGGAIRGSGEHVTAVNCTFNRNEANYGGAIAGVRAVNCTFTHNNADFGGAKMGSYAVNCTFDGNEANQDGGAIWVMGSNGVFVVNCTFIDNYAWGGAGGAINSDGMGTVVNCTFNANCAQGGNGGAIYGGSPTVVNCTFFSNVARSLPDNPGGSGGAMSGGSAVNCTFEGNWAYLGSGGAIFVGSAVNCTFKENRADEYGGAMSGGSAVNCTFEGNLAPHGSGGAMSGGSAVNCVFNGNQAYRLGSAMFRGSADTCVFIDNDCHDTEMFGPSLSVDNLTSFYNSGDKLLFNLSTHSGMRVTNRNITIDISTIDGQHVGTYYSLSDGWIVSIGPGKYIASCKATDFDMEPVNASLIIQSNVSLAASYTVSALDDGFAVNIVVRTDPAINDNLTVTFKGKEYPVEVVNGTAKFTSDKVYSNSYNADISYAGDDIYFSNSTAITAVVKSTKVAQLHAFNYFYYNNDMGSDSEKGISQIKVVDVDGNPIKSGVVTITIMNKYKLKVKTDANGVAKFTKAYKPGTYSVTAEHNNKVTKLGDLVLKSVVNLPKVSKVSKSAKTTTIKITLKGTGPIKGKTVVVSFMKVNYKVQTDKNGVALFKVTKDMVSKLGVGKTYKIRATYRMDSVAQGIQILK